MKTTDKLDALGMLGERLALKYLESKGHKVELSFDKYDYEKDITVDGNLLCEVKTQQPWHLQNSFTIKGNQLRKCKSADILLFVETPSNENGNKIAIWDFSENKDKVVTKTTRDNRTMYLYNKKYGKLVATISDEKYVNTAKKYNSSQWRGKK